MSEKQAKPNRASKFYDEFPCCRIRERIAYKEWTLTEAAERMRNAGIENVTPEAVRQWTGGYSRPDMNKLKDIAAVLDCSINYLFGVDDLPDMTDSKIQEITGLDETAILILRDLNGKAPYEHEPVYRIINGIIINKAFHTHILRHGANAISIQEGAASEEQIPEDVRKRAGEAVGLLQSFNGLGYTEYIPTSWKVARDTQIQYAADAFKAILQHIVEKEDI
ncbi:MAG: helix-turn-helix domain-containing protein [Christensenellales bacterium]|jgi:transcriptional regulator with XRE-family HTH domain